MVERLAERAGVDLSAAAAWLIVRLHDDPHADIPALCRSFDIPVDVGERALQELAEHSLVTLGPAPAPDAQTTAQQVVTNVTPEGEQTAQRLIEERRASIARLCPEWSPDEHADLQGLVHRLAAEALNHPSSEVATPAGVAAPA
jgi:hypothetical protein